MKKFKFVFISFIIMTLAANFICAQNKSAAAANRKTAERCLSLSESFMLNNDWQNALNQAELGLSYDEDISDLFYVKAAAQSNLGYKKAEVLQTIRQSFSKDNWINYTKNSARILYADILCATGLYEESLAVLDMEPLLYSADSEFIRIKNYYRIASAASIAQARARLNSSRRIYPKDARFPNLFFMFEMAFMNYAERSGAAYEIPELVQTIADSYIAKLPDYSSADIESEIIALLFCKGEEQKRLLKAVGEKNQNHPLFAYAGLKAGIISEEKAFNLFFETSHDVYNLNLLESFGMLLKDPALIENFADHLKSFEGTLYIDNDLDLINELTVTYERGRAKTILYDKNSDGIEELYALCDFGSPLSLALNGGNLEVLYENFPSVSRITDNSDGNIYHFLSFDFNYNPFEMTADTLFTRFNVDFYIPLINSEIQAPDKHLLARNASSLEIATAERPDSRVNYTVFEGRPVFAVFMSGGQRYAYATIEPGYPFVRYADYDGDGVYETAETFDIDNENKYTQASDIQIIKNIFGQETFSEKLYLKKIEIDRNGDTYIEFSEQYLGNQGKISSWDTDADGILDYEYIRYPDSPDGKLIEETILYNKAGEEYLTLQNEEGLPKSLKFQGQVIDVIAGQTQNYFWVGEEGTLAQEQAIFNATGSGITEGAVQLVKFDDELRLSVIKIGSAYFCKKLAPSEVILLEEAAKEKEE